MGKYVNITKVAIHSVKILLNSDCLKGVQQTLVKYSKIKNYTLQIFIAFEKFTRAYLFQIM